jgi:REP element-mobilizing transposase RayT
MPRGPRVDAPGLAHHVWHRGVGRQLVFLDSADCENFVERLQRLAHECGIRCFAWALMGNHFHLVIQVAEMSLATFMARLMTGYARYFNDRHGRVGHVFQNRYGSRAIEDDADLASVVVYVNRNPLEAGLVRSAHDLAHFPWASYGALVAARRPLPFERTAAALSLFGRDVASARAELEARVARGEPPRTVEPPACPIRASMLPAERAILLPRWFGRRAPRAASASTSCAVARAAPASSTRARTLQGARRGWASRGRKSRASWRFRSRHCAGSFAVEAARRGETYARTSPVSTHAISHWGILSSSPVCGSFASSKHTRTRWPTATSRGARFSTFPITRTPGTSSIETSTTT